MSRGDCADLALHTKSKMDIYYSIQQAKDSGWNYIKGPSRLVPETGWVCPDCSKKKYS